ncbi:MAG: hypothetical protein ACYS0F_20305, partial [Planctomycetota bacterium]
MTRKRTRENLTQQLCDPCPICEGKGFLRSPKTLCHKIFRELPKAARCLMGETLVLKVHPDVAELLEGSERATLERSAAAIERKVEVQRAAGCHPEQFEISATGARLDPRQLEPATEPAVESAAESPDPVEVAELEDSAPGPAESEPEAQDGDAVEAAPAPPAALALRSAL